MITWLPATVSTAERFRCLNFTFLKNLKIFSNKMSKVAKFHGKICNKLEDIIISLILNYPVFWIVTLGEYFDDFSVNFQIKLNHFLLCRGFRGCLWSFCIILAKVKVTRFS